MSQIYLISPPKIELESFSSRLELVLKTSLVPAFQLRLKDYPDSEVKKIASELNKICQANNCLFILNDSLDIALEINASGVHLGVDDGSISLARQKSPKNFIIGASCYDSRHLAMEAAEQGADYISFGAFFPSKTKKSQGSPGLEIIQWSSQFMNLPIVAIGGITDKNSSSLVKSGADFISVISYIWDCPDGEVAAVKRLNDSIID